MAQGLAEVETPKWRRRALIAAGCLTCIVAIGIAVAAVVQGRSDPPLAVAIVMLGFVQLMLLLRRRPSAPAAAIAGEGRAAEFEPPSIASELDSDDMGTHTPDQPQAFEAQPAPAAEERAPEPQGTGVDLLDRGQLELFLEPVVDIVDRRTVYYRASVALTRDDGSQLGAYLLGLTAERGGFAPALDLATFRRVCPVVRHLRARNRRPGVFCPLAPDSFAQRPFLEEFVTFLRANEDAAGAMVIEISQPALGALSPAGMEGLAYLAELGATFCLSEAQVDGPDLPTLVQLGFQFIDLDVAGLASSHGWDAFQAEGAVCGLGRRAEQAGLTVIAANLVRSEELDRVRPFVRLARGTLFSPPRVVRRDITEASPRAAAA